jgi:hypothetical protein
MLFNRTICMKPYLWLPLAAAFAAMAGCGGVGASGLGTVSGIVTDANGDPVRDAKVFTRSSPRRETRSNSSGSYVLQDVRALDIIIEAEVVQDGIKYYGQNLASVFGQERTKSVNIQVARENQLARISGSVSERQGLRVVGARVFAIGNSLSSSVAITDSAGNYTLRGLIAGVDYVVQASARTYNSDTEVVRLFANENRQLHFVLADETNPALPPPFGLEAVSWTTPAGITRSEDAGAYEHVKRLYDPRRAKTRATSRLSAGGNPIEIDLYWEPDFSNALLGFGIYRGVGQSGPLTAVDFLRDPLAEFFADNDPDLVEQTFYSYEMTALNTSFPDFAGSESARSNRAIVRTLGDMIPLPVIANPLTFRWQHAPGAEQYIVYLFDRFPRIGVPSIWSNSSNPAVGTQVQYTGSTLQSGKTYFWLVLGVADGNTSRTMSTIESFVR